MTSNDMIDGVGEGGMLDSERVRSEVEVDAVCAWHTPAVKASMKKVLNISQILS